MTIQEAIRKMAAAGTEPYCKVCTVDAVDEDARTVDCTPLDEGAPLVGAEITKLANGNGDPLWSNNAKQMLQTCGVPVSRVSIDDNRITIE